MEDQGACLLGDLGSMSLVVGLLGLVLWRRIGLYFIVIDTSVDIYVSDRSIL